MLSRPEITFSPAAWRSVSLACAAALCVALPARAALVVSGAVSPAGVVFDDGNNAPPFRVDVGTGAAGSLTVTQGSTFQPTLLYLGHGAGGNGVGLIDGAGSHLRLSGLGQGTRLIIGQTGTGVMTVSGGAMIDGTLNASPSCLTGACGAIVGHGAGGSGTLNVTGAGSQASFVGLLHLASPSVLTMQTSGFVIGTPGARAVGSMSISNGAVVRSTNSLLATGPNGPGALGTETSFASVVVDGVGSLWRVTQMAAGSPLPGITTANHANATAEILVRNGGRIEIDGGTVGGTGPNAYTLLNLSRGGNTTVTVTGAGSAIDMRGMSTALQVGRQGGQATMNVFDGAAVNVRNLQVGRDGATGRLLVSGAGSTITLAGRDAANTDPNTGPVLVVGRAGTGHVEISQSAKVMLDNTVTDGGVAYTAPARVLVAVTADSSGTVLLSSGALLSATYVGIARSSAVGGDSLGIGSMAITGATLRADMVEVGSTGLLINNGLVQGDTSNWGTIGGAGTFEGKLSNFGTINPGNSPGRLAVNGDFVSGTGNRLVMEIADDGQGGFVTDALLVSGQVLTPAALNVTFRFLGGTDPNAFLQSGAFKVDTFFGGAGLNAGSGAFQGAAFSAESMAYTFQSFSFDVQTGAQLMAVAVPEPTSVVLMAVGLLGLLCLRRRRG